MFSLKVTVSDDKKSIEGLINNVAKSYIICCRVQQLAGLRQKSDKKKDNLLTFIQLY